MKHKTEQLWAITFRHGSSLLLSRNKIDSPTIEKYINYIEREPGCTGLTLENGMQINRAQFATV